MGLNPFQLALDTRQNLTRSCTSTSLTQALRKRIGEEAVVTPFDRAVKRFLVGRCSGHDDIPGCDYRNDGSRLGLGFFRLSIDVDAVVLRDRAGSNIQ